MPLTDPPILEVLCLYSLAIYVLGFIIWSVINLFDDSYSPRGRREMYPAIWPILVVGLVAIVIVFSIEDWLKKRRDNLPND